MIDGKLAGPIWEMTFVSKLLPRFNKSVDFDQI